MTVDIERIGDWCTLYHADSGGVFLDLYLANPAVLVTDPPYGNANSFGKMARPSGTRTMQFDFDRKGDITPEVVEVLAVTFTKVNAFHVFCGMEQYGSIRISQRMLGVAG